MSKFKRPAAAEPVAQQLQPGAAVRPRPAVRSPGLQLARKYLQAADAYGTNGGSGLDTNRASSSYGQRAVNYALPTWGGAPMASWTGRVLQVQRPDHLGVEAQNLTDSTFTQYMQQRTAMMGRAAWGGAARRG